MERPDDAHGFGRNCLLRLVGGSPDVMGSIDARLTGDGALEFPAAGGRLAEAKAMIAGANLPQRILLAADGGIREHTVPVLREAGAETIVMGSLAFGAPDLKARVAWVHAQ